MYNIRKINDDSSKPVPNGFFRDYFTDQIWEFILSKSLDGISTVTIEEICLHLKIYKIGSAIESIQFCIKQIEQYKFDEGFEFINGDLQPKLSKIRYVLRPFSEINCNGENDSTEKYVFYLSAWLVVYINNNGLPIFA